MEREGWKGGGRDERGREGGMKRGREGGREGGRKGGGMYSKGEEQGTVRTLHPTIPNK